MGDIYHAGKPIAGGVDLDDSKTTAANVWSANKVQNVVDVVEGEIDAVDAKVEASKVLVVTTSSFSALPQTINNTNIKTDHVVINSVLSNPAAQTGDWTWTTNNGSIVISGSISGSTTLTLYLAKSQ